MGGEERIAKKIPMPEKRWPANVLHERAKELRRQMTPAETALWAYLRRKQVLGYKFRRQHVIGSYIVDFCCIPAGLVVEVDGAVHNELQEHDEARDAALEERGYRVLHLRNEDVLQHLEQVLLRITAACRDAMPAHAGNQETVEEHP